MIPGYRAMSRGIACSVGVGVSSVGEDGLGTKPSLPLEPL